MSRANPDPKTPQRRVPPEIRTDLAKTLRRAYEAGASIRQLATEHHRSYGQVHTLLDEAGTTFRTRGGRH